MTRTRRSLVAIVEAMLITPTVATADPGSSRFDHTVGDGSCEVSDVGSRSHSVAAGTDGTVEASSVLADGTVGDHVRVGADASSPRRCGSLRRRLRPGSRGVRHRRCRQRPLRQGPLRLEVGPPEMRLRRPAERAAQRSTSCPVEGHRASRQLRVSGRRTLPPSRSTSNGCVAR